MFSMCAMAQHTFDGDGFYVNVENTKTIVIGLTDASMTLFTDDEDREMDVEVYHGSDIRDGYEVMTDEISDPDFVVNIKGNEMCTPKTKYAIRFARAMMRVHGGAVIRIDVVDGSQPKGNRQVYMRIPAEGAKAIADAYYKLPLW